MPWDKDNPPSVAKNWTSEEQSKCIETANAVLRDGGSEESAIFACIKAAGKTKHPGGKDKDNQETKGIELLPVTASDIASYGHTFFGGESDTEPQELLKFVGAKLCEVGVNANGDGIDEQGIEDLAESLQFMAVCDEHKRQVVCGFMLNGRAKNRSTELFGDGVIFAARFPSIATAVQDGTKRISIEAVAKEAKCESCGKVFASKNNYCEHLKAKTSTRWLSGLQARGIATVEHPAWETSFDENGFVMIASDLDCGCEQKGGLLIAKSDEVAANIKELIQELKAWVEDKLKPVVESATTIVADVILDETGGKKMADFNIVEGETLEELKTRLELVAASDVEQAVNAKDAELKAGFEASTTELKTGFEAREVELKAETDKVKVGFERALGLGMGSEQASILGGLEEDEYVLFKKQQKEIEVQASTEEEEKPKIEAGQLQDQVLSITENVEQPLSLQNVGEFLKKNLRGGK